MVPILARRHTDFSTRFSSNPVRHRKGRSPIGIGKRPNVFFTLEKRLAGIRFPSALAAPIKAREAGASALLMRVTFPTLQAASRLLCIGSNWKENGRAGFDGV